MFHARAYIPSVGWSSLKGHPWEGESDMSGPIVTDHYKTVLALVLTLRLRVKSIGAYDRRTYRALGNVFERTGLNPRSARRQGVTQNDACSGSKHDAPQIFVRAGMQAIGQAPGADIPGTNSVLLPNKSSRSIKEP